MEAVRRRSFGWPTMAVVLTCALLVMLPQVYSIRYIVGSRFGWTNSVNYTNWAKDKHFYNGDWLFFVYDRNQMNVLELNKTDYESCNTDHPLHNWTTGAGRDVVPLNVTKTYYFASGKGYCYGGMKVAIHVEKAPPPPKAAPVRSSSTNLLNSFKAQIMIPALFATAAVWDAFLLLW
ncbi:early nodulin-like protein 17 [Solanum lycopersicum]|uniref:Phytocyanin domain-containing protein n=1 Tax=Solanum lycopersicum TaxID=4081 RepID=A0A3Q7F968_SOLLC|nr:lamin-like protein [Solanum lycopersicum]